MDLNCSCFLLEITQSAQQMTWISRVGLKTLFITLVKVETDIQC